MFLKLYNLFLINFHTKHHQLKIINLNQLLMEKIIILILFY